MDTLFHILRGAVVTWSQAVIRIEICFVADFEIVQRYSRRIDSGRRERVHNRDRFQVGRGDIERPEINAPAADQMIVFRTLRLSHQMTCVPCGRWLAMW